MNSGLGVYMCVVIWLVIATLTISDGHAKDAIKEVTTDNLDQLNDMSIKAPARQKRQSVTDLCETPEKCPYRTADGSYNNLNNPTWCQFQETQLRWLGNAYNDSLDCCGDDKDDITNCFSIAVPDDDQVFEGCLPVSRSQWRLDENGTRQQINLQTSYLDGSHIYGANQDDQDNLRTKQNGQLDIVKVGKKVKLPKYTKPDRPCNLMDIPEDDNNYCTLAGDRRSDENPQLAAIHTLFLREHNRIAGILKQYYKDDTDWNDEKLFQETRKIVIAELQHITYNEYLPSLVGEDIMKKENINVKTKGFKNTYNTNVDATTSNSFNVAVFRMGHSQVQAFIGQLLNDYTDAQPQDDLDLHFFKVPLYHSFGGCGIDHLVRWTTHKQSPEIDRLIEDSVRNKLFNGRDLSALNIQRSREHGVPGYNEFRALCNLPVASHFGVNESGLADVDAETASLLEQAYVCPSDIDLFPGMLSERHIAGASVGPLLQCLLVKQFAALRFGDRFFYENYNPTTGFNLKQLNSIKKVTMASVICANTDTTKTQGNVFVTENTAPNNGRKNCKDIPPLDIRKWMPPGQRWRVKKPRRNQNAWNQITNG